MSSTKVEPIARKKGIPSRRIVMGIIVAIVCLRLLWLLPITRQVVIPLLARPKEISVPALTAPNAIKPETVAEVHLLEHWGNGTFYSMTWSPDGRYFAVGTTSGVNMYDAATFQLFRYIDLPLVNIDRLVFSPDSGLLAVSAAGNTLVIIDLANDKILQQWEFEAPMMGLTYLNDGTLVRVMEMEGEKKHSILKWVNDSWQAVKILDDDFLSSVAFVPEKQAFVVFYSNSVRLVDPLNGMETTLPYTLPHGVQPVLTHNILLTIDNLDRQLFSVYKDGRLFKSIKWDGGGGWPTASPDGNLLATLTHSSPENLREMKITLWDIPALQPARTISVPDPLYSGRDPLAFSPVGDRLAFLASRSTIRIFSIAEDQTGEVVIQDPLASLMDVAITPQGEIRAVSCPGTRLEILSLPSVNSIDQWHSNKGICGSLLNGAGAVAVWTEYDSYMRLYQVGGVKPPVLISGKCCGTFSADGNVGVSSDESHTSSGDPYIVAIWQKNFAFYQEWKFYHANVYGICSAVSPSGQYVAAADGSHTYLWIHGIESGRQYPLLLAKITFSPDEKHLASTQGILDLETGLITATEIAGEENNYDYGSKPVFSPDGQILAAAINGTLAFWRVSDGALLAKLDDPNHTQKKLVFSSDGTFLVGLGEGFVNVWGRSK